MGHLSRFSCNTFAGACKDPLKFDPSLVSWQLWDVLPDVQLLPQHSASSAVSGPGLGERISEVNPSRKLSIDVRNR